MARTPFKVEVLTPEGEVFNDEVEMVSTRTGVGSLGILANHAPLMGMLEPTELRLMVPLRASLDVSAVAADVDVQGLAAGELSIDSVSGDVAVAAAPRKADINSVSGDLNLTLNSSDIQAETVSGTIRLRGRINGEVEATSVSGDI